MRNIMANDATVTEKELTGNDSNGAAAGGEYGAENIQVLKNAAHIRQNPGVYIGESSEAGMHHLLYEVLHNSIDEAMAGYAHHLSVKLNVDGSATVEDDGRGIPVEMHPVENRSTLELVMCEV